MATHKIKANTIAKLWDAPEGGQKGELQAGVQVTVAETRNVSMILYSRLSSHNQWWTKSGWLEALPVQPPPPPPTSPGAPKEIEITLAAGARVTIRDANGNILHDYTA